MSIASPPEPMTGPIDMCRLYPRFVISGTINEPIIAVFAMLDPESAANTVPPEIVTYDKRPGIRPNRASRASKTGTARPV